MVKRKVSLDGEGGVRASGPLAEEIAPTVEVVELFFNSGIEIGRAHV